MNIRTTDYYKDFECLAGECPKTCCANWNIPIDRATRAHYRSLEGVIGKHARSVLKGGTFKNKDGRCPFLQENGLCSMIIAAGNQGDLSFVCRTYPRKISTFGNEQHISLSVSCPMAARQLLQCGKMTFVTSKTDEPPQMNSIDPALYKTLIAMRDDCICIVQDDSDILSKRVEKMLHKLNIPVSSVTMERRFAKLVRIFLRMRYNNRDLKRYFCLLKNSNRLQTALQQADHVAKKHHVLMENLLVYMLDRYVLEAVDDGDYASRIKLCLHWCMMFFLILCDAYAQNGAPDEAKIEELLVDYSRHTEHNDRNLRILMRAKHII